MTIPKFSADSLSVKYSYRMAKEIALASAEIRQRHYEAQQSNPEYWEEDKAAQEADGVEPDPATGVAVPVLHFTPPSVRYERGEPDHAAFNEAQRREQHEAAQAALAAESTVEEAEVEQNTLGIVGMMRAAPKVLSAMLKPSDSPMALKRLEVCKGCEHWTGSKCRKCGCFTALKVRLPSEACPIGKWAKEE